MGKPEAAPGQNPVPTGQWTPAAPEDLSLRFPCPFGRYELRELLGKGGMGMVFLAQDLQLDRLVALKIPHWTEPGRAASRERFLREARAAAALAHPNLCPVYDVGEVAGVPYLTMAFLEGTPLSEVLRRGRRPTTQEAAQWARDIALAIHEAHRHGIIHRDLKRSNVMMTPRGQPIVMDFGLAYRAVGPSQLRLTQSGDLIGTPAYMAPEQLAGDAQALGPGSDVYSLGVILYEMLTGRLPFEARTVGELIPQIERDPPLAPCRLRPGLDSALERICLRALAKRPEDRFASMGDFAAALGPFAAATALPVAVPDTAPSASQRFQGSARRWCTGWGTAALFRLRSWTGRLAALCTLRGDRGAPRLPAEDSATDDFDLPSYEAQLRRARVRRKRIVLAGAGALLLGLVIYAAIHWGSWGKGSPTVPHKNPFVTRETFRQIKVNMTEMEVGGLLGTEGFVDAEEGLIVDKEGNFRRWVRAGNGEQSESGRFLEHDGKAVQQIKKTVCWQSGEKAIWVTFDNGRVVSTRERGLYRGP
jgi:predicted Ser/Thr protein kinase